MKFSPITINADGSVIGEIDPMAELCPCADGVTPSGREMNARLTVLETIVHQNTNDQPVSVENRSSHDLRTHEQPISRTIKIGEEWTAVNEGWIETPSLISLLNREGQFTQVRPTPEEVAEAEEKIIEVGVYKDVIVPLAMIRPGRFLSIEPSDFAALRLRCRKGIAKVSLHVFPE